MRRVNFYQPPRRVNWKLVFALRFFDVLPFALPRLSRRYFVETAIACLDPEADLLDGSNQISAQCGSLRLGAMAKQAMPKLGVGLSGQLPQTTVEWIQRKLSVDLYQCILAATR